MIPGPGDPSPIEACAGGRHYFRRDGGAWCCVRCPETRAAIDRNSTKGTDDV